MADIFRLHGPAYRARFGDRMLPSHRRAMQDIEDGFHDLDDVDVLRPVTGNDHQIRSPSGRYEN